MPDIQAQDSSGEPTAAKPFGQAPGGLPQPAADGGEALELTALFQRIQKYLAELGKFHDVRTLEELLIQGVATIGSLFPLSQFGIRHRVGIGPYRNVLIPRQPVPQTEDVQGLDDLIAWAFDARQVLFYDLDGEQAPATGETTSTGTLGILPFSADPTSHSAILFWSTGTSARMNLLQTEMLQTLSRSLSARAAAIAQAERHTRLASLFDDIIESVPQAIVAVTPSGHITAINANAEFLFDVKRIFAIDEPYADVLPAKLAASFADLSAKIDEGGDVADNEIEVSVAGDTFTIGVSVGALRDRAGELQGYLFLCRDMSLSREVRKLRELDQMKSEFVNTVSHELKTPLTAILGGLEVIQSEAATLPEETREMLDIVGQGAARLRNLIFDLLDVSRLETGKVSLREESVAIGPLITEALKALPVHPSHRFVVDADPALPPVVMDRAKITQCVTNYASNAIKYSPKGGTVTISARSDTAQKRLVISVTDQGVGIAPEHHRKVWDKFYRVDSGYTREIEGTGLGLVIVKRIAELHGGGVALDSDLGRGSTFSFWLPLRSA